MAKMNWAKPEKARRVSLYGSVRLSPADIGLKPKKKKRRRKKASSGAVGALSPRESGSAVSQGSRRMEAERAQISNKQEGVAEQKTAARQEKVLRRMQAKQASAAAKQRKMEKRIAARNDPVAREQRLRKIAEREAAKPKFEVEHRKRKHWSEVSD